MSDNSPTLSSTTAVSAHAASTTQMQQHSRKPLPPLLSSDLSSPSPRNVSTVNDSNQQQHPHTSAINGNSMIHKHNSLAPCITSVDHMSCILPCATTAQTMCGVNSTSCSSSGATQPQQHNSGNATPQCSPKHSSLSPVRSPSKPFLTPVSATSTSTKFDGLSSSPPTGTTTTSLHDALQVISHYSCGSPNASLSSTCNTASSPKTPGNKKNPLPSLRPSAQSLTHVTSSTTNQPSPRKTPMNTSSQLAQLAELSPTHVCGLRCPTPEQVPPNSSSKRLPQSFAGAKLAAIDPQATS